MIVKIGSEVIETYGGVNYREKFKISPIRKVIDKLFALRQKYKDGGKEVMQLLVNLLMIGVYGEETQKDIEERLACKSEYWMFSQ